MLRATQGKGSALATPEASTPGRVTIRPHRSYRTMRVSRASWIQSALTLPLGVVSAYIVLLYAWPRATAWFASMLVRGAAPIAGTIQDSFFNIVSVVPVPIIPPLEVRASLNVAGICVVIIIVVGMLKKYSPLPLWFQANVIALMLTSLWAFFNGAVAYDGPTFMLLLERTSVLMLLASPIFAVVVASLLPFSPIERAAMFIMLVAFPFAMSVLRLGAFAMLLTRFGVLAEANLYLFFGPLIDVVYFIMVYSFCVVSLSKRIAKGDEAWEWL